MEIPPSMENTFLKDKKAYIFDLDGTLLDTLDDLVDSVNYTLTMYGMPARTKEEIRSFVGNGMLMLIRRSVPQNLPDIMVKKIMNDYKEHYGTHNMIKTKPYKGIPEALDILKKRGIKLAVISNKADVHTKYLCEHFFFGVFDLVYGERAGIAKKPAPDSLLAVIDELGLKKEDCVYVGDSEVDVETSANAGVDCLSVSWGFRDISQLSSCGARHIITDTSEMI